MDSAYCLLEEHEQEDLEVGNEDDSQSGCDDNVSVASKDECRICADTESTKGNRLISPCECTGSISKVHVECLEKWILNRPGNRAAGDNLECEICHSRYRVSLRHRLKYDMKSLCSCATFSHLFEGCFLIMSILCIIFVLYAGLPKLNEEHGQAPHKDVIILAAVIAACLMFLSLRRLFIRWHRTTSIPRVSLQ
mmetsp:Transcript_12362/g.20066  ORF Transcript_12362/g.20066 Transcript_12362/m.20066 type:complete len:194 (+) Transcript_12362:479-1060(+)